MSEERARSNPYNVGVGQVWLDRDPRYPGRLLAITAVTAGMYARTCTVDEHGYAYPDGARARRGRIRLDRFHRFTLTDIRGHTDG